MKRARTLFILLFSPSLLAGTLTATVDSTQISRNETLTLTLKYDERTGDKPDTNELEKQFNIRRQGTSSGIRIINGDISGNTTWEYELSPKRIGQLSIPSFSINGDASETITIDVTEKSASATQTDQKIYTETALDKTTIFTQQQAVVAWRFVSRAGAPQVRLTPPHINGVITQDLGNRSYQRTGSNGRSEWVIEQSYALFPQQSGKITIPTQTFQAIINAPQRHRSGFFVSVPTEVSLDTEEKQLEVMSPPSHNNKTWLPAESVEILQQITGLNSLSQATAGTAFTRTIRTRAKGLSAEQLPAPDMQASNIKIYPEKPVFENKAGAQGNTGTREDSAAIIATQAGKLVLPAIRITWYDVNTSQWRDAVLEESIIEVLPNLNAQTQQPPNATPTTTQQSSTADTATGNSTTINADKEPPSNEKPLNTYIWQIAVGILLFSLLVLAVYIYYLQRKMRSGISPMPINASTPKKLATNNIQQAVADNNLPALHRALTEWANTPERLTLLNRPDTQPSWHLLEKHLFGNGPAPSAEDLQTLASVLKQQTDTSSTDKTKKTQLSSLY
ncbi:MAG: BatD family protein [Pseudomonadales bacterium]